MQIFISYSKHDRETVTQIVADFRSLDYTVWYDQELSGGTNWWKKILREILDCDLFVFILTNSSLESVACAEEYKYANKLNKRILPIKLEDLPNKKIPQILAEIQYVNYVKDTKQSAIDLMKALNRLPEALPLPKILPDEPINPISPLSTLTTKVHSDDPLSREEQIVLLFDLRNMLLDDSGNSKVASKVLKDLHDRTDTNSKIKENILYLLNSESKRNLSQDNRAILKKMLAYAIKRWHKNGELWILGNEFTSIQTMMDELHLIIECDYEISLPALVKLDEIKWYKNSANSVRFNSPKSGCFIERRPFNNVFSYECLANQIIEASNILGLKIEPSYIKQIRSDSDDMIPYDIDDIPF